MPGGGGDAFAGGIGSARQPGRCGLWGPRTPHDAEALSGIVEADETSSGVRSRVRVVGKAGRSAAAIAQKTRHASTQARPEDEQVPVLVTRDRNGSTHAAVLADSSADAIDKAIGASLPADGVLCTDSHAAFGLVARKRGIHHEPVNIRHGEHVRNKSWHIQNANARHSRLKAWIAAFKGIATHYLPNYLAWHHMLDKKPDVPDHREWLRLAINS
ncbi:MAG: IS1595 family transposase [Geminicoccaceae bacterium]